MSHISWIHYIKLVLRSLVFLAATVLYIVNRIAGSESYFGVSGHLPYIMVGVWIFFTVEMLLRFFPSRFESMGCQKQFKRNYIPTGEKPTHGWFDKTATAVLVFWLVLNGIIGILYGTGVIDTGILVLISLAYSVCDMICILFFCPFQTWFMKNKCCGSCRIYNWDYAMMFTPLVFTKDPMAWSLFFFACLLLVRWEVTAFLHPERFSEETNECLSCKNCKEKLCHHKKQLRHFLKKQNLYNRVWNRKAKKEEAK
ncbi:MAG: hypothetical protein IJC78_05745 [Clostridia bacterium]|nr:hypothetical protein [Clostridia bacterium]